MVGTMTPMLTTIAFVVVGAVVGGFMARRLPMNKARVFCAVGALIAAIGMVARAGGQDSVRLYLGSAIAVIMGSFMLIALLYRRRTT